MVMTQENIMATVYLVQMPRKKNHASGEFEDAFNVSPAAVYGEITHPMFPSFGASYYTQNDVHHVRRLLKDYSDDDCILLMGDPAAIGLACSLAAEVNGGRYNILRWDRTQRQYMKMSFNLRGN